LAASAIMMAEGQKSISAFETAAQADSYNMYRGGGTFGDVIWRRGQDPIRVSPEDTIMATKDPESLLGGGTRGGDTNIFYDVSSEGMKDYLDRRGHGR
jgi:hypothetical protein